jgi:hypothetical protein
MATDGLETSLGTNDTSAENLPPKVAPLVGLLILTPKVFATGSPIGGRKAIEIVLLVSLAAKFTICPGSIKSTPAMALPLIALKTTLQGAPPAWREITTLTVLAPIPVE